MGKKIMNKKKCIVIMGVAGAGKSTLGNLFTNLVSNGTSVE